MSRTHYGACIFLWIFSLVACKVPEVRVTCIFSEDCVLPCSYTPTNDDVKIQWYQQEALILSLQQAGKRLIHGNVSVELISDSSISDGNASLLVRPVDTRSRGRYKCVVNNGTLAYAVATVEAPIRSISIDINPSGLIQCSTKDVYPAPVVQWSTEPRSSPAVLQHITHMAPGGRGLFRVESILKQQNNCLDHVYVCNISSRYGTQTWTASLQLQEITGFEGKDLVIPSKAPKKLQSFSLVWTFTAANKTTDILTYDSRSRKSSSSWDHAKLEEDNSLKGGVSLTLKNPGLEHSGIYTCTFLGAKTRHLVQTRVVISSSREGKDCLKSNMWMLGIFVGLIVLLALILIIKIYKVKSQRNQDNYQEDVEIQSMSTDKTSDL